MIVSTTGQRKLSMPIDYAIDHARRLIVARGTRVFCDADVFAYQREVWSQPAVASYDELVDMSDVEEISATVPAGPGMQHLASIAAAQDPASAGKFAIVAPSPLTFGLAREYQTYRELQPHSKKKVEVFHTLPQALAFLGIESLAPLPTRRVEGKPGLPT